MDVVQMMDRLVTTFKEWRILTSSAGLQPPGPGLLMPATLRFLPLWLHGKYTACPRFHGQ